MKEEVDEVERLRFLFTLFFDQTQALQSEAEAQREIALINQQHRQFHLQRADTMNFRKHLRNKIVMMVEEEGSINWVNLDVNAEATNAHEQLIYELIKLYSLEDELSLVSSRDDLDSIQGARSQYPLHSAAMEKKIARMQQLQEEELDVIVETESSKEPLGAETKRLVGDEAVGDELTRTERDLKYSNLQSFQTKDRNIPEDMLSNLAIMSERLGLPLAMKKTP